MNVTFVLGLGCLVLLAGCSDDDDPKPDATVADAAVEAGVDTGPKPDKGPIPDLGPASQYCGVLKESSGALIANADILVCNDHECHTDTSSSTGTFCVQVRVPEDYMVHFTEQKQGSKHFGDAMFPVKLTTAEAAVGTKTDVGDVVVPIMGASKVLDEKAGGSLDLGGGIKLVVGAGVTTKPPLLPQLDVAAVMVEKKDLHARLLASGGGTGDPVAALVTVPLETSFSSPASFELPAPAGLADSTALEIYWVDEKTAKLTLHGEATVSGGVIKDVSGKGIKALGWFLFYKK